MLTLGGWGYCNLQLRHYAIPGRVRVDVASRNVLFLELKLQKGITETEVTRDQQDNQVYNYKIVAAVVRASLS